MPISKMNLPALTRRLLFLGLLLLIMLPAWAWNKCVIDGKTVYQANSCPGEAQNQSHGDQVQNTPLKIRRIGESAMPHKADPLKAESPSAPEAEEPSESISNEPQEMSESPTMAGVETLTKIKDAVYGPIEIGLLIIGCILLLYSGIQSLIRSFQVGVFWGLGCIFIPFFYFIFLIVHWDVAKTPFFIHIGAMIMIISAALSAIY